MTEVPKIVHDRLRAAFWNRASSNAGVGEGAHPDADLLTAFAEQALSGAERDGVLGHLALCEHCREVVALALPAAAFEPPGIGGGGAEGRKTVSRTNLPSPHKLSFASPSLRWVALAAGVAVAAAVLLIHPGKLNQSTMSSASPQIATTAPASAVRTESLRASSSSTSASSMPAAPIPLSQAMSAPRDKSAVLSKTDQARLAPGVRSPLKLAIGQAAARSHLAESGRLIADNQNDSGSADRLRTPSAGATFSLPVNGRATESVEVSGAAVVEAAPSAADSLMARNDTLAIEKAKPAAPSLDGDQKSAGKMTVGARAAQSEDVTVVSSEKLELPANPAPTQGVAWVITAGVLKRSQDSGQSWQNALRTEHLLLCYANHEQDVWAGGEAGTVFHSADGGVAWVRVQPSIKAQVLTSDVTRIDLRGPSEIAVSTSNNEIWSSADGGKTWEKK
jgi:hypothetical protein